MIPTYSIRTAGEDDVDAVLALRRHAEDWLRAAGIEQWTRSAYGARVIKGWIGAGSTFVVEDAAGEIIGTLSLDAADPDFWTPRKRDNQRSTCTSSSSAATTEATDSETSSSTGPATAPNSPAPHGSDSTAGAPTPNSTTTTSDAASSTSTPAPTPSACPAPCSDARPNYALLKRPESALSTTLSMVRSFRLAGVHRRYVNRPCPRCPRCPEVALT